MVWSKIILVVRGSFFIILKLPVPSFTQGGGTTSRLRSSSLRTTWRSWGAREATSGRGGLVFRRCCLDEVHRVFTQTIVAAVESSRGIVVFLFADSKSHVRWRQFHDVSRHQFECMLAISLRFSTANRICVGNFMTFLDSKSHVLAAIS